MTLFWTLIIIAAAMYVTTAIRAYRDWEVPSETVCNLDYRDLRPLGLIPPDCPADHPTNWFVHTESETTK